MAAEWAWRPENAAGDILTFYGGVGGSVGDGSPSASLRALESEGASEAAKACMMKRPARRCSALAATSRATASGTGPSAPTVPFGLVVDWPQGGRSEVQILSPRLVKPLQTATFAA